VEDAPVGPEQRAPDGILVLHERRRQGRLVGENNSSKIRSDELLSGVKSKNICTSVFVSSVMCIGTALICSGSVWFSLPPSWSSWYLAMRSIGSR
jgi:hypothetical protein